MIEIDKQAERAQIEAELSAIPLETLCERLRGVVRIPVNDGAGLLNGSSEFIRQFETGPISHVAARTIESLRSLLARWAALDGGSWHPDRHAGDKADLLAETRAIIGAS